MRLLFGIFGLVSSLTLSLDNSAVDGLSLIKELPKNTIHFKKIFLHYSQDGGKTLSDLESIFSEESINEIELKHEISISNSGKWQDFSGKNETPINMYSGKGTTRNFFFTTPKSGVYEFKTTVSIPDNMKREARTQKIVFFLKIKEMVGAENNPNIVSKTDTVISSMSREIQQAINFVQMSSSIISDSRYSNAFFEELSSGLIKTVVIAIFLKLIVVGCSVFVANRSTKIFFRKTLSTSNKRG